MDRREAAEKVGRNVADAAHQAAASINMLSEAADMPAADLTASLNGDAEFTVSQLVRVGGFLHVQPSMFLEGIA